MDRSFRPSAHGPVSQCYPTASSVERFAQDLLGIAPRNEHSAAAKFAAERKRLEWLAAISTEHEEQLQHELNAELEAERHSQEALAHQQWLADISTVHEAWDPSKHPRGGNPENTGQFSHTGGSGGAVKLASNRATFQQDRDTVIARSGGSGVVAKLASSRVTIRQKRQEISDLSRVKTPSMRQADDLADDIQNAKKIKNAAVGGLKAGGKAIINGTATAIKNVATLGLSNSQLEIIGVTKEDRARGYDTAITIATATGELVIAVGTAGVASALSKGGRIAQVGKNALGVFDASGNIVGVVKGAYDASQDKVNFTNGAQIAAGVIGLKGAAGAAKAPKVPAKSAKPAAVPPPTRTAVKHSPKPVKPTAPAAKSTASSGEYRVGKHSDMPRPRNGNQSHHGVMSEWMRNAFPHYNSAKAPAILMPEQKHFDTFRVYQKWRAETRSRMGGTFDWKRVSEAEMRQLSEQMLDAADVPMDIRKQYWAEFDRMLSALRKTPSS
jgi:hypothetical protein